MRHIALRCRHVLQPSLAGVLRSATPSRSSSSTSHRVGYVFDIDGVLLRGGKVLSAGHGAMELLYDAARARFRAPVAFLTNGGGHSEAARAARLSDLLGVPVAERQVVLSHTPMRAHSRAAAPDRAVVTVGSRESVDVARAYGYPNVVHIEDVGLLDPSATPFTSYDHLDGLSEETRRTARLPAGVALVMNDSDNFQRDLQLLVDMVGEDVQRRPEPLKIIFANADKTFPNEHARPRLAGGMLRVALDAVLREHGGRTEYEAVQLGKPHSPNYELAEISLLDQLGTIKSGSAKEAFDRIYMVGDNPPSDVRGARLRGRPWHSLLVRSGNFRETHNDPHDPADDVVDDALHAVASTKPW